VHTIIGVRAGKTTQVLKGATVDDSLCFSLVSPTRTLDLQCATQEQRDMLLRGFQLLVFGHYTQGYVG
jgi:hypothetical protein